jgi:hypothetical protein
VWRYKASGEHVWRYFCTARCAYLHGFYAGKLGVGP